MKFFSTLMVLLGVSTLFGSFETALCAEAQIVNRIAATVNGRPVTSAEVRSRLVPYIRELMMLYPRQGPRFTAELVKAKKAVINELIERELVLSEFETKGMMLPETMVEEELNRRILYQFNGKREELLNTLRQSGMTLNDYRDSIRKETTVAAMRSTRYDRGIPPTPDEIRAEYNATKSDYRDITQDKITYEKIYMPVALLKEGETADQLYALALEVKQKIENKEMTFAEAAHSYSSDQHAEDGGVWPPMKRADLAVDFANVVFGLQPGELVGPLLDPNGFTLVRVISKELAPAPPLSKVKEAVDDAVRRKQSEKRYREWVTRLREKAVVRTFI